MNTTSTARTPEGRGENTLQVLRDRYRCSYITIEQLLQDHLTGFSSRKSLIRAIEHGRLQLRIDRMYDSRKAPVIVYLHHLADFLDRAEKTAATAAA